MSERTSTGAFVNCSGLANAGVPTNPPWVSAIALVFSATALATPKSMTLTTNFPFRWGAPGAVAPTAAPQRRGYNAAPVAVAASLCRGAGLFVTARDQHQV